MRSANEQLHAWLAERRLDQALAPDASIPPRPLRYPQEKNRRGRFSAGDVLILRPVVAALNHGPVYVLLLEEVPSNTWRAVPFSRYSTPAVPGEWQTRFPAPALAVLCFWNIRVLPPQCFLPAPAKKCTAHQRAEIHEAAGAVLSGKQSHSSGGRFGPPLIHPADPRYEYLDEERERIDLYSGPGFSVREGGAARNSWLMAAEGRPGYGKPPMP